MKPTLMTAGRGSAPPGSCTRPGRQSPQRPARAPEARPAGLPAASGPLPTASAADGAARHARAANPRPEARRTNPRPEPRTDQSAAGSSGRVPAPCVRDWAVGTSGAEAGSRVPSWRAPTGGQSVPRGNRDFPLERRDRPEPGARPQDRGDLTFTAHLLGPTTCVPHFLYMNLDVL
ncbi:translation initiation factor IF-2-like [Panthera pardus]|uniref:Translation initiation factor IF-2-like n=1 Tax=Panthera pardus TaxID=9691 RepID=A0A9W2W3M0_PANPR|nr:translation initiation factor IF-2-like [Panthera pardus]